MPTPTTCWACDRPFVEEVTSSYELTDEQWGRIEHLFDDPPRHTLRGRPRTNARDCFEGVLWVLRSGARWKDLPKRFPSSATCWRRFQEWTARGVWSEAWEQLLMILGEKGKLDREASIADGTFSPAKKGVLSSATPSVAREPRSCCLPMATDFPWALRSPQRTTLK